MGYHPNAFITGDDVANAALNFLERGWNGENFHEVTENLRSSDPYMVMADFRTTAMLRPTCSACTLTVSIGLR